MNNEIPPKTSADKDLEIEALKQKMAASKEQDKELLQAFIDMNPGASKEKIDSWRKAMNLEVEGEDITEPIILNEEEKGSLREQEDLRTQEEKKVDETRRIYTQEYLKCKKEMRKKVRFERTRTAAFNMIAGVKNIVKKEENKIDKKHFNEEEYFTPEYKQAKESYDKARVEMGNDLYDKKRAELEELGLAEPEIKRQLATYKATEILQKTIIDERNELIKAKAAGSPINPAAWKKLVHGYMKLPRLAKIGISTALFAGVAATGAITVTGGLAGAAVMRFAKGMGSGFLAAHSAKGYDLAKKKSNEKFKADQALELEDLKKQFGEGTITQEGYEKSVGMLEKADQKRTRKQTLIKAAIGIAVGASVSGFMAQEFGGGSHPTTGNSSLENTVKPVTADTLVPRQDSVITQPIINPDTATTQTGAVDTLNKVNPDTAINQIPVGDTATVKIDTAIDQQPPATVIDSQIPAVTEQTGITHSGVEVSVGKGNGAIETINELKEKLEAEYPDQSTAPESVKHILNTKADRLAMEYGMFKPNEVEESAMFKVGGKFNVDESGNVSYQESTTSTATVLEKGAEVKASGTYEGKMIDSDRPSQPRINTEPAQKIPTEEYQQERPELKQIDESGLKKISPEVVEKPEVKDIDMSGLKKISGNDIGESIPKGPEDLIDQGADKNTPDLLEKKVELVKDPNAVAPEIIPRATPDILEDNGITKKVTMTNAPGAKVPAETFANNNANVEPTRGIFNDGTRRNISEDLTPLDHKGIANMTRLESDLRNLDTDRDVREVFGRSNVVIDKPESPIVENNVGYREWNAATNDMLAEKEVNLDNYADYEKERELQQLFGHAEHKIQYVEKFDKNMEGTEMYYYKELPEWKTIDKIPARYFFDMENAKPSIPDADWKKLVETGVVRQSVDNMGNTHYAFANERELKRLATVYNKVDPLNSMPHDNESMEKYIARITRDLHQTKDGTLYMFKDTRTGTYLEKSLDDGSIIKREVMPTRNYQGGNGSMPVNPRLGIYPASSELNPNGPFAERLGGIFGGNMFGNNSFTTPVRMSR